MKKTAIFALIFVLCTCLLTGCRNAPGSETMKPSSSTVSTAPSTRPSTKPSTRPSTQTTTPSSSSSTTGTETPGSSGSTGETGRSRIYNDLMR